ncbi:hypothetical protein GOP47_0004718 [Adiantum capillus-veneris]|uniref:Uncharacterized protein n=1 Tax=Adiantum capillus-veneris TaxID=13818 RepID=A0A9D4ZKW2_ADICA|nr:hypothetical protein GOP47_0004718 [Adiantum capillus-veneris]
MNLEGFVEVEEGHGVAGQSKTRRGGLWGRYLWHAGGRAEVEEEAACGAESLEVEDGLPTVVRKPRE